MVLCMDCHMAHMSTLELCVTLTVVLTSQFVLAHYTDRTQGARLWVFKAKGLNPMNRAGAGTWSPMVQDVRPSSAKVRAPWAPDH